MQRSTAGILLMVAAVTCFTGLDATAKWASQSIPPLETVAIRYLAALVFITASIRPWKRLGVLRTSSPGLQLARGFSLVLATTCSFTALHYMPLGQATAIQFAAPLVIAGLAGPLLGEWPGPHRVAAILVGFAGVLVVTRPGLHMQPAVFLALGSAACSAAYALLTRRLAGRDRPTTTLFFSGLVGGIAVCPLLPFVWTEPPAQVWVALILMGALGAGGHYLLILANERTAASTLAPFTYTQLVGATLLGLLLFDDAPDRYTLLGGTIVAASGIYLVLYERRRSSDPGTVLPTRR